MPRAHIGEAVCPACNHRGMEYNAEQVDLPYLGESLETMIRCDACGFRHTDFVLTATKDPTRHIYVVSTADDMSVRVVRSASGTVRIPELGILIEPGVASEAFITNVEGILVRIERVLGQMDHDAEEPATRARIDELAATLRAMRDGAAAPVTVIIDDPYGNSAILHEDARVEPIAPEEAAELKTGTFVVDRDGTGPQAA